MLFISGTTLFVKLNKILSSQLVQRASFIVTKSFLRNQVTTPFPILKPLNSKISWFMRNGQLEEAQKMFDQMPHRNTVTWNAMLRGYFLNGHLDTAVKLFDQMPQRDIFSYNTMIDGLMRYGKVDDARSVFHGMPFRDLVTWNSMLSGYVHNEMMGEALRVFEEMSAKDVISWNLVIGGLVNCGELALAKQYFEQMSTRDVVSWTIMISGLSNAGQVHEACELFQAMPTRDLRACNAMLVGYLQNGYVHNAEVLFQKMPRKDFNSWIELVNGMVRNERVKDAIRLFMEMPQKCQRTWNSILLVFIRCGYTEAAHAFLEKFPHSDIVSWTNIIVGYFQLGEARSAAKIFESMSMQDTTLWNAMIFGLGDNDHGEEGLRLYMRMKESGPPPDKATLTSVLTICSDLPSLHFGKQIHGQVVKLGFIYFVAVSNAMVTMYARCGYMHSAVLEFSSMLSHDVISWNSIICGFAHHGDGKRALEMFDKMLLTDVRPNDITFIGVLSACSYAGLVDQGKYYFDFMRSRCSIHPKSEHYTCIVDLLARYGLINEAMSFLNQMKVDGVEVSASVWGALLGACRIYKNTELGEIAGEKILEIEPYNSGIYLILAELYLSSGKKADAEKILFRMKEKGVKKQPGCSWIEVNNSGQIFLSGDGKHPQFSKLCCILDLMYVEMENKIMESVSV